MLGIVEAAVGYVLAVPKSQPVPRFGRIDYLFSQAPDQAWEQRSCGDGAKGPRVYDWTAVQLPVIEDFDGERPTHHRWALARRSISRPEQTAYYLAYAPVGADVDRLVRVAGRRWAIEECFQAATNECGPDQYEVRRYVGWMRHITLAMLAHAFRAATAAQAAAKGDAETVPPWFRSPWQKSASSWQLASPATSHPCAEIVAMAAKAPGRRPALSQPTTMSFVGRPVWQDRPDMPAANYTPDDASDQAR
ncbi:hypothetical protein ACFYP4_03495 [Streptomyces sp. NPDC005551]|uniref:hypothetical protein n=1 Tax=Streptomyces sp. NPDC005551 TaxID=3364725 RepID=UPI0036CE2D7F